MANKMPVEMILIRMHRLPICEHGESHEDGYFWDYQIWNNGKPWIHPENKVRSIRNFKKRGVVLHRGTYRTIRNAADHAMEKIELLKRELL